ncbi:Pyruvate/2-oxoglutarate dehydrogenase, dihydrolipoamide acyltransferase (E2) [Pyrobaculum oguniense TE7]|uniref:Pyruvate/2-oxoglutarate dehydrogenase, dihydrolipoamide acyltransferase (E2) n=1 Tax=Pyrobaculum oguniense (strain DSM 13380 / JCM 10595 / TE7) TaxID=698757 RepID=H6Q8L3_PYROT|nr:Pyruvate/2-oxoglutarate dehydrogenase, dihydrolipoamide acyltransferase (E2) [Pyrobaculum oguniense TE7]
MIEFKFPDLGEGLVEGEIVKWHVKEGDFVKEGDPLVDVMTEKANVTLPAPATGKVVKILAKEGEIVKVGQVLCVIEEVAAQEAPPKAPAAEAPTSQKVAAMPAARRLARELGIDLSKVKGTGPGGVITVEDVRRAAEELARQEKAPPAPPPAAVQPPPAIAQPQAPAAAQLPQPVAEEERIPVRGIRRAVAEKMAKSASAIPHAYHFEEVDVTELVSLRERLRQEAERLGVKLTYLPFVAKAVAVALREFPMLNSSFDEERGEIVVKRRIHLGFAVDTEQGLMVVVVRDADKKSVLEIARELNALAERARAGKASVDEVRGSTFTITNIGAIGGVGGLPIINYPEAAIMALGKIRKIPRVVNGAVVPRDVMNVVVGFDHRVVDGAYVARFTNRVKELLEDVGKLLLYI